MGVPELQEAMSGSPLTGPPFDGDDPSHPPVTRDLLSRYLAGSTDAERRLFERFREALLTRARRHPRMRPLQRRTAVEDVVHEVLVRALSSGLLRGFEDRGKGSLERALTTILDRTLVDLARRTNSQKRSAARQEMSLDAPEGNSASGASSLSSEGTTPTSRARANELLEICQRVLDAREWEVWKLVEVQGLDSAEAASRLGTTSAAVRGLLLRARAKLVRRLESQIRPQPRRA